jgi:hypothetical protein
MLNDKEAEMFKVIMLKLDELEKNKKLEKSNKTQKTNLDNEK